MSTEQKPTEFVPFPKMARFSRECVITEKIDGTNASILIEQDGQFLVGSRTRWITPKDDNAGFARWAYEHKDELMTLGPGHHFGEWWGKGIQRGYGLNEKRFSLFNTSRWVYAGGPKGEKQDYLPKCCHIVPELVRGQFDNINQIIHDVMLTLKVHGSFAADGFKNPEGIVIFHVAGNFGLKKTFEKDDGKFNTT